MSQPLVPAASLHTEGPDGHTATPELEAARPVSPRASSYGTPMGLWTFGHVHRCAQVCGCAGMAVAVHFHMHLHGCVSIPEHVSLSAQQMVMHVPGGTFMPTRVSACPAWSYTLIRRHDYMCTHTWASMCKSTCLLLDVLL